MFKRKLVVEDSDDDIIVEKVSKSITTPPSTPNTSKKFKYNDYEYNNILKHYIIDYNDFLTKSRLMSLFKKISVISLHDKEENDHVVKHYHVLGEAKFSQRYMRDMSIASLKNNDIIGGLDTKNAYINCKIKNIANKIHFENTYKYIKRAGEILFDDPTIQFGQNIHPIFKILDSIEEPKKYSKDDMDEFRRRFPLKNQWKKIAAQYRLSKKMVDDLQEMEDQRKYEDLKAPLTDEQFEMLIPNSPLIEISHDLRNQLIAHDKNSGVCLILCGSAMTCKSTINRIIAESFGEYNIWPGSQWIQKDPLKFDSAARQGVSTIVVEEMQWIDIQHKVTLEKTLTLIKVINNYF